MNSTVYLNGAYLGNQPYGFSTFEYDVTPNLTNDRIFQGNACLICLLAKC